MELLKRADEELMVRYQGQSVCFWEAPLRSRASGYEGSGTFLVWEGPEAAEGMSLKHLDRDQRNLPAAPGCPWRRGPS